MLVKLMITKAPLVWWPKMNQATSLDKLGRILKLAFLRIAGTMRITPRAVFRKIHLTERNRAK